MTVSQYRAQDRTVPEALLHYLVRETVISNPLTPGDQEFLRRFRRIWRNHVVLRSQLRQLSRQQRATLVATADLRSQWERYVFTRYANHDPSVTGRLPVRTVLAELHRHFELDATPPVKRRVYSIRRRVENRRAYARRKAREEKRNRAEKTHPKKETFVS